MKKNLEVYRAQLTVLGPVFIGSGNELSKKEYLFLNGRKTVGIIDIQAFYRMVSQKGLRNRFEMFMMDTRPRTNLSDWIRENGIKEQEIKKCLKYTIDSGDTVIQRGTPIQIMECIKDPYGMPYIPGSSIKGMLRTILLNGEVIQNPERFRRGKEELLFAVRNVSYKVNRNQFLMKEKKKIEEECFYSLHRNKEKSGDAVNDKLSGMIIGDSEALTRQDLVLCQKVERHTDGTEKKLNLLRECIRPGTRIHFSITLERDICPIRSEDILKAIELFNEVYYDCFLRAFWGMDYPKEGQVYLGGGTGFVSKTLVYPLLGKKDGMDTTMKIFQHIRVPQEHKHYKDVAYGVSPHIVKCTNYQGTCMQMGCCKLEFL